MKSLSIQIQNIVQLLFIFYQIVGAFTPYGVTIPDSKTQFQRRSAILRDDRKEWKQRQFHEQQQLQKQRQCQLSVTTLSMSLKLAAVPLMDSGKALARSGELLIDLTRTMDCYGGGLSSAGADIRNAGDCIAQAAASARFKTAIELVIDELRESGNCLKSASEKMTRAVQEARQEENDDLAGKLEKMIQPLDKCGRLLEDAGATVLRKDSSAVTGGRFSETGEQLAQIATIISTLLSDDSDGLLSSQRLSFAGQKMTEAGNELQGIPKKRPTGKGWLKGS